MIMMQLRSRYSRLPKDPRKVPPVDVVKNQFNIHYILNVSVGTPPQYFRVALETAGTLPLVLPSVNCAAHGCDGNPSNRYDASLSSTYKSIGVNISQPYKSLVYGGYSSIDHASINGLSIPDIEFLEWTEQSIRGLGIWDFIYDGIISLSPPWRKGFGLPSLLAAIDERGNLDAPMFSLELNRTQNGTSKLVIGAKDMALEHPDTIKLPIVDHPNVNFTGLWTTPIKSLSIQSASNPHQELPFPGEYTAMLDPGTFQTILPRNYGKELLKYLGAVTYQWINLIDCSIVPDLPDLLFTFGKGQTVRITSEEYVLRISISQFTICTIAIDDNSDHDDIPDDIVVLGSSFLRGFHSIWDWGNRTIGCR
jgi:saccharopepsin